MHTRANSYRRGMQVLYTRYLDHDREILQKTDFSAIAVPCSELPDSSGARRIPSHTQTHARCLHETGRIAFRLWIAAAECRADSTRAKATFPTYSTPAYSTPAQTASPNPHSACAGFNLRSRCQRSDCLLEQAQGLHHLSLSQEPFRLCNPCLN